MSTVTQRQSISYSGGTSVLLYYLHQLTDDVKKIDEKDRKGLRVFSAVSIIFEHNMVTVEVGIVFNVPAVSSKEHGHTRHPVFLLRPGVLKQHSSYV